MIVADDAPPVLLDFGAARRVISDRSQTLTAILKPSYAPLEQYAESQGMRQGPWTDFYALGATLHYLIAGKPPVPATARAVSDDQPRLAGSSLGNVPDLLLQVVDWMLAPRPHDRPQNVAELRAALAGHLAVPQRERRGSAQSWQTTVVQSSAAPARRTIDTAFEPAAPPATRRRRVVRGVPLWGTAVAMADHGRARRLVGIQLGRAPAREGRAGGVIPCRAAGRRCGCAGRRRHPGRQPDGGLNDRSACRRCRIGCDDAAAGKLPAEALLGRRARGPAPAAEQRAADQRSTAQRVAGAAAPPAQADAPAAPPATTVAHQPPAGRSARRRMPHRHVRGRPPVTVAVVTRNPRERCAGRHLVAMHRCLVRECEKPSSRRIASASACATSKRARATHSAAQSTERSPLRSPTRQHGFHTMR